MLSGCLAGSGFSNTAVFGSSGLDGTASKTSPVFSQEAGGVEVEASVFTLKFIKTKSKLRGFPGGPVVKSSPIHAGGVGSIPGWGAEIPTCLVAPTTRTCNRSNMVTHLIKALKNGSH